MSATSRIFDSVGDAIGRERVFGSPVTTDGVTVIPASRVVGGGGGGEDSDLDVDGVSGGGAGFGVIARPVGALVIKDGNVRWRPTVDVTRVILGGQAIGIAYFICTWLIARTNARAAIKIAQLA